MNNPITLYSDDPILVVSLDHTFSVGRDTNPLIEEVTHTLDHSPRQLFYIVDVTNFKITFEDLVTVTNVSARSATSYLHHANIRELIVVTTDKLTSLGVKGLQAPVFGVGKVTVIPTIEEALAYCRERVTA